MLGLGMVPALLMFGTASVGFGGHPWIAFAGGAVLLIAYNVPEKAQRLWRHRHEPNADVALGTLLTIGLNLAGALGSAWAGYGIRLLLRFLLRVQQP
jgi:hypothetical protein